MDFPTTTPENLRRSYRRLGKLLGLAHEVQKAENADRAAFWRTELEGYSARFATWADVAAVVAVLLEGTVANLDGDRYLTWASALPPHERVPHPFPRNGDRVHATGLIQRAVGSQQSLDLPGALRIIAADTVRPENAATLLPELLTAMAAVTDYERFHAWAWTFWEWETGDTDDD